METHSENEAVEEHCGVGVDLAVRVTSGAGTLGQGLGHPEKSGFQGWRRRVIETVRPEANLQRDLEETRRGL